MKIKIDKDEALYPGDRIEMSFQTVGLVPLVASQIAYIEWRLKDAPGFRIRSWEFFGDYELIFTIDVIKANPALVTAAVIGGIILSIGILGLMSLREVRKIVDAPAARLALGGFGSLAIVVAIAAAIALLPKGKK